MSTNTDYLTSLESSPKSLRLMMEVSIDDLISGYSGDVLVERSDIETYEDGKAFEPHGAMDSVKRMKIEQMYMRMIIDSLYVLASGNLKPDDYDYDEDREFLKHIHDYNTPDDGVSYWY